MNDDPLVKYAKTIATVSKPRHPNRAPLPYDRQVIRELAFAIGLLTTRLGDAQLKSLAQIAEIERLQERVAQLETQCDRCGLKQAHSGPPEHDEMYVVPITTSDGLVHIDYKTYGEVFV